LLCCGVALVIASLSMPVYTDPEAPSRISMALSEAPREVRFKEWYLQLKAFETPHKSISDLGRGVIASGIGLWLARIRDCLPA